MFVLVANPESPRARLFIEAARAQQPAARVEVVPWLSIVRDEIDLAARMPEGAVLRLDSAGQDAEVERELLALGYEARAHEGRGELLKPDELGAMGGSERGRLRAPRQQHLGFLRALERIEAALAARPDVRAMTTPAAVRELFDKRITSRVYRAAGVPVPRALEVASSDELLQAMDEQRWGTAVVKVATSSSASCLAVVQRWEGGLAALSTVETTHGARYNSRRLSRYGGAAAAGLVDFLLGEGAVVEELVPKARLPAERGRPGPGRVYDLRVLVIAGEPALVVGRASRHPITNLHLGGIRLEEAAVRALVAPERWDAAMADAARAARLHDALHVGLDLAFVARGAGHVVFEANAFGDHLNGVTRDGLGAHALELRALGRSATSGSAGARSSSPSPKT